MSVNILTDAQRINVPFNASPDDFAKLFRLGTSITVIPTVTAATGDAILPNDCRELTVICNSANSAHFVQLPAPVIGTEVTIIENGTACKLVTSAPATVGISGGTGASASVTIAANTIVKLICTSATNWRGIVLSATIGTAPVQVAAAA